MQFLTILNPTRQRYQIRVNPGGRGTYSNDFEYELYDDPTVEGIAVGFGPSLGQYLLRDLWSNAEIGAKIGATEAQDHGLRLCCVRFMLLSAKYHDVDTTPRAVQLKIADCVHANVALRFAEPISPFRKEWLTSDVIALARGIHTNSALDALPMLYDALLEAGCDDPLVTEHLKTCPDHSPSCWVAEMICAATV